MKAFFNWHYKYADIGITDEFQHEFNVMVESMINLQQLVSSKIYFFKEDVVKKYCPGFVKHLDSINIGNLLCGVGIIIVYPGTKFPIHVDHEEDIKQQIGLNFPVRNCENSFTVWYKNVEKIKNLDKQVSGDSYTDCISEFSSHNPIEVARCELLTPVWINSGLPHTAESQNPGLRISASFRFHKEILELLKNENFISR